jgi:UDP-GlcNAc:undecaprenyl-phosphate GlcNAc-1-phosphate transferase
MIYAFTILLVSIVAVALVRLLFPKFNLLDNPKAYGFNRAPVPYSTGIVIALIYLVSAFYYVSDFRMYIGVLLGVMLLVGTCFVDDYKKLPPLLRLFVQFVAASIVVFFGAKVLEITNPIGGDPILLGGFAFVVSVLWIVTLTNLMNFLDGVSGLTSGVGSIGFWVIFLLSAWPGQHITDQTFVMYGSLTLAIACSVFAFFEFYPPRILIGDSGTMLIGFMLGVFSLINGGKLATVALVLLIPILDGIWIICRRLYNKKSPFKGDLEHMHYKLLKIGFSERKILFLYLGLSILFGLIAVYSWNSFFKLVSLILLTSGLIIFGIKVWIHEKK